MPKNAIQFFSDGRRVQQSLLDRISGDEPEIWLNGERVGGDIEQDGEMRGGER
jgi:hypothetical protein